MTPRRLDEARRDARQLVESDPGLAEPDHARLRQMVTARYGRAWNWATWGKDDRPLTKSYNCTEHA